MSGDDCIVFALGSTGVQTTAAVADIKGVSAATATRQPPGPLDDLLQALLPADASIAVVAHDASQLPRVGDCHAVSPPDGATGLHAVLAEADATGAQFVVIPAGSSGHVRDGAEPAPVVGDWRLVTHQRHLGDIYEREEGAEAPAESSQPAVGSPPANGEPADRTDGLWQRILGFFRR